MKRIESWHWAVQWVAAAVVAAFFLFVTGRADAWIVWAGRAIAGVSSGRSFSNSLTISTAIIGSIIAFVKISPTPTGTTIVAQIAPDAPLSTPSGWTASDGHAGSKGKPIPPNVAPTVGYGTGGAYQSAEAACMAALGPESYDHTVSPGMYGGNSFDCYRHTGYYATGYSSTSCPAGYTASGGTCVGDPETVPWPSDGECQILRNGNSYSTAGQDPDCASGTAPVTISGGTVTAPGNDGTKVKIETSSDGTTKVTQSTPQADGNTRTETVHTGGPRPGSNGPGLTETEVDGRSSGVGAGQGALEGTGTTPGFDPTGLNQESTQQQVLAKLDGVAKETTLVIVKDDVKAIKETLDTSQINADEKNLTVQKDELDTAALEREQALSEGPGMARTELGLGFSMSWPGVSCSDFSFSIPHSSAALVVPLCAHHQDIQAGLNWMVSILTAFSLFYIGVGALKPGV